MDKFIEQVRKDFELTFPDLNTQFATIDSRSSLGHYISMETEVCWNTYKARAEKDREDLNLYDDALKREVDENEKLKSLLKQAVPWIKEEINPMTLRNRGQFRMNVEQWLKSAKELTGEER